MITRYITQITATFNPLSAARSHRIPRLILARLPSTPEPGAAPVKVNTTILPASSSAAGKVAVSFKDGKQLVFDGGAAGGTASESVLDLNGLALGDVVEEIDRHCRVLRRKEEIS